MSILNMFFNFDRIFQGKKFTKYYLKVKVFFYKKTESNLRKIDEK